MNAMFNLMKFFGPILLLVSLAVSPEPLRAADEHSHDAAHGGELMLNDGQKWSTDEPLRLAMSRISKAVAEKLPMIHEDTLGSTDYIALGKTIDGNVSYMIENCKLSSDADAMLHIVLVDLLQGSEAMQGKAYGIKERSGAIKVIQALHGYSKHFDHPGWQSPTH